MFWDNALFKAWDENKHPRHPAGSASGGQFASSGASGNAVTSEGYEGAEAHEQLIRDALEQLVTPQHIKVRLASRLEMQSDNSLAEYNRRDKEILVSRAFMETAKPEAIKGVIAHEIAHDEYQTILNDRIAEYQEAKQQYDLYFDKKGKLKQAYHSRFPAIAMMQHWESGSQTEVRAYQSQNVSDYAVYHYKNSDKDTADNETLSEVARLVAIGKESEVPESWLTYYKARKAYLKARRK